MRTNPPRCARSLPKGARDGGRAARTRERDALRGERKAHAREREALTRGRVTHAVEREALTRGRVTHAVEREALTRGRVTHAVEREALTRGRVTHAVEREAHTRARTDVASVPSIPSKVSAESEQKARTPRPRTGRAPGGRCPLLDLGRHHSDHVRRASDEGRPPPHRAADGSVAGPAPEQGAGARLRARDPAPGARRERAGEREPC